MLLLFGIPVYVWMKWRQSRTPVPAIEDFDRALLRREYAPAEKPSAERRVPVGVELTHEPGPGFGRGPP